MIPGYKDNKTVYPGLSRTNAGLGGNIPQQTITGYHAAFYKRLYKSHREAALLLDKPFCAGYGCLEIGTVLAEDQNSDGLVPYTPDTISDEDPSRVFLLNDCASGEAAFDVELLESYKVASGETVIMTDTDGGYEAATINDIDRDTYNYKAIITLSGTISIDCTTANKANCYLKAEDNNSGKRSKAVYVLDMEVDTGAGEYAKGGLGSVLLSNAIIYQDACVGMDAQAITDLGNVSSDGAYYIIK